MLRTAYRILAIPAPRDLIKNDIESNTDRRPESALAPDTLFNALNFMPFLQLRRRSPALAGAIENKTFIII